MINIVLPHFPRGDEDVFDLTDEVQGVFDAQERAILATGRPVEFTADTGDEFSVRSPELAVFFNGSRVPELQMFVASGYDPDTLEAQAIAFRAQHVSAEYASRHNFLIMPVAKLPPWVGKTYAAMAQRQRREKDDVCAWKNVQAF